MTDHGKKAEERAAALEKLARKFYEAKAPKAAPEWDEIDPMQRYAFMEAANDVCNTVLEVFEPASPDTQAVIFNFQMAIDDLESRMKSDGLYMVSTAAVIRSLRNVLTEVADYGAPKHD